MSKVTLNSVADLTQSSTAQTTINTNSSTVQTAFDNTLSRDGTSPNQMGAALDMNSNQIINLPSPSTANSPARLIDVTGPGPLITVPPVGTSGATVPLLNANNTFSGIQTFTSIPVFPNNSLSNAELALMNANTIKGNNTGSPASPIDLTATQATAVLNTFVGSGASHAKGLVPDPGVTAGTSRYLREDGTFATPGFQPVFNVKDPTYGAKGDTSFGNADGNITATSPNFTTSTTTFTLADVGKTINIAGAGTAGAVLATTIASFVSAHAVTLTVPAITTVTNATFDYGTDDNAAVNNAIVAAAAAGGHVYLPKGVYFIKKLNITAIQNLTFFGDGWNSTYLLPNSAEATYGNASGHLIDLTGSLNINLRDFQIGWFGQIQAPTTAIFQANILNNQSNANILTNIYASGQYTAATYYNTNVASSQIYSCKFYNYRPGAGSRYVGVFTQNNATFGLTSSFQTVVNAAGTTSDITIVGTEWHFFPGAGASSGVIWIDGATDLRFYGGNITGGGTSYVVISNTVSRLIFSGVSFETESQPVTPSFLFSLSSNAVLAGLSFPQCFYVVGTPTNGLMTIASGGQFTSGGSSNILAFQSNGTLSPSTTYFVGTSGIDTVAASNESIIITERGLIFNMFAGTSASPAQTPGYTISVLKNGSASGLTGIISGSNTSVKDQTHVTQVNPGDTICFQVVTAATTSTTRFFGSVSFIPTG